MSDSVLTRFAGLAHEFDGRRRWYEGADVFRYAALPLATADASPAELARRVLEVAEDLKDSASWFGAMKSQVRLLVASLLVRDGSSPAAFQRDFSEARHAFRRLALPKNEPFELFATLLMRRASGGSLPTDERVWRRLGDAWHGMKQEHRFLTGPDDLLAAALLATGHESIPSAIRRIERLYEGLRDAGVSRGGVLQLISHVLYFAALPDERAARRFVEMKDALSTAGVWIWRCDFDEIALLATLDESPRRLAEEVVSDRARIKRMKPRPGGVVSFSLACGTTFLRHATPEQAALHDLQVLLQVQAILTSGNTAATTAATSTAVFVAAT